MVIWNVFDSVSSLFFSFVNNGSLLRLCVVARIRRQQPTKCKNSIFVCFLIVNRIITNNNFWVTHNLPHCICIRFQCLLPFYLRNAHKNGWWTAKGTGFYIFFLYESNPCVRLIIIIFFSLAHSILRHIKSNTYTNFKAFWLFLSHSAQCAWIHMKCDACQVHTKKKQENVFSALDSVRFIFSVLLHFNGSTDCQFLRISDISFLLT